MVIKYGSSTHEELGYKCKVVFALIVTDTTRIFFVLGSNPKNENKIVVKERKMGRD
jgi:hypothetical protein